VRRRRLHLRHHAGGAQQRRELDQALDRYSERQRMVDREERRGDFPLPQPHQHEPDLQQAAPRHPGVFQELPGRRGDESRLHQMEAVPTILGSLKKQIIIPIWLFIFMIVMVGK